MRFVSMTWCIVLVASLGSCAKPWPVDRGMVLTVSPSQQRTMEPACNARNGLSIDWLGTSCHVIRFGDTSVMTDPFFSYYGYRSLFFGRIPPKTDRVLAKTKGLQRPDAIFIGHAHYDHLLDLAEMIRLRRWGGVPLIGSETARNIVHGFDPSLMKDWIVPRVAPGWHEINEEVAYMGFPAEHAPQVLGKLWYPGSVDAPRTSPPTKGKHFPVGQLYAYAIRIRSGGQEKTTFFTDAAMPMPVGLAEHGPGAVDVAVLCAAGWEDAKGYPMALLNAIRPRYVVASHLDDFFNVNPDNPRLLPLADLEGFIREVNRHADWSGFSGVLVPDVDCSVCIDR